MTIISERCALIKISECVTTSEELSTKIMWNESTGAIHILNFEDYYENLYSPFKKRISKKDLDLYQYLSFYFSEIDRLWRNDFNDEILSTKMITSIGVSGGLLGRLGRLPFGENKKIKQRVPPLEHFEFR